MADWVAVLLTALCAAPLVAQRLGGGAGVVRRVTRVGAVVLWAQLALDTTLASMVLLPPALLLLTIAVVGTGPPAGIGAPRPRRRSP
jgi:hypothetical protein